MLKLLFLHMVSGSCLCCFVTPSSHHIRTEQMIPDPKNFQSSIGHDTINRLGNNEVILVHASSATIPEALFYFFFFQDYLAKECFKVAFRGKLISFARTYRLPLLSVRGCLADSIEMFVSKLNKQMMKGPVLRADQKQKPTGRMTVGCQNT